MSRLWGFLALAVSQLTRSEAGGRAIALFATLVGLSLAINALNIVNSFVGRDVITAVEQKSRLEFIRHAAMYVGVFALQTAVAVSFRFSEERLAILWRERLTSRLLTEYVSHGRYVDLQASGVITNPDQRITEDVRALTVTSLSVFLMVLNGTFAIVGFSGVLWSIHPQCFVVAAIYALLGTAFTVRLGSPLVELNYDQLDREAELRTSLIRLPETAASASASHGARSLALRRQLEAVVANAKKIVAVNRNLALFTTGYNYLIQLIPVVIVGQLFMRGEVQFGAITQAGMAFSALVGALSLIVTQFSALSSYAAVLERTGTVMEALSLPRATNTP